MRSSILIYAGVSMALAATLQAQTVAAAPSAAPAPAMQAPAVPAPPTPKPEAPAPAAPAVRGSAPQTPGAPLAPPPPVAVARMQAPEPPAQPQEPGGPPPPPMPEIRMSAGPRGRMGQEPLPPLPPSPPGPEHFYHLDLRVLELSESGKIINSRSFAQIISTGPRARRSMLRSDDQVPVPSNTGPMKTYHYEHAGIDVDTFDADDSTGELALTVNASVNSIPNPSGDGGNPPLMRHMEWNSRVLVPLGKPTVVTSSDDLSDRGRTELEITARRIGTQ
jgi:hypothetical protein